MDNTDTSIIFDENGVCDHCNTYFSDILSKWHQGDKERRY